MIADGVFDGKRVMTKSSSRLMMAPSDLPFRSLPLGDFFKQSYQACAGVRIGPNGVTGTVLEGIYMWGGWYSTIFYVDPQHDASFVLMTQSFVGDPEKGVFPTKILDAAARSYLDA